MLEKENDKLVSNIEAYKYEQIHNFSLFGGPLHRLGNKIGLVKNETNTIRLGVMLSLFSWGILVLLTLLFRKTEVIFSLSVIGAHVRLLLVIPLFFLCETLVAPRMDEFVSNIVRSGHVPENKIPSLIAAINRVARLKESWVIEVVFVILIFSLPLFENVIGVPGRSGNWTMLFTESGGKFGWILIWYFGFCLPLFRFLLLRWVWHMLLWWYFLWQVKKLKLNLIALHSDGVGGLGYLEVVQEHFIPLILAISLTYAAAFAEDIVTKTMMFQSLYFYFFILLFFIAIIFIGPLFLFSYQLWVCRSNGLNEYMVMAAKYVRAFDKRWMRKENMLGAPQLGTADMQSLADLTNSVNVVRKMHWIPLSRRLLIEFALTLVIPFLPLFLMVYPFNQLIEKLLRVLAGP